MPLQATITIDSDGSSSLGSEDETEASMGSYFTSKISESDESPSPPYPNAKYQPYVVDGSESDGDGNSPEKVPTAPEAPTWPPDAEDSQSNISDVPKSYQHHSRHERQSTRQTQHQSRGRMSSNQREGFQETVPSLLELCANLEQRLKNLTDGATPTEPENRRRLNGYPVREQQKSLARVRFEEPGNAELQIHSRKLEKTPERVQAERRDFQSSLTSTAQARTELGCAQLEKDRIPVTVSEILTEFFERLESENQKVVEEARKLQAARAAEAKAAREKEEEQERKNRPCVLEILGSQSSTPVKASTQGQTVYTRVPKVWICKEVLDESGIEYTEQEECLLIHQQLDHFNQQYLASRTKWLREFNAQVAAAAAYSPMVAGPDGNWYRHISISGFPCPLAFPVPGGPGQWPEPRSGSSVSSEPSSESESLWDTSSEASNTSPSISPAEHVDHKGAITMGCNDPVFRAFWIQSHLLTPIEEGTQVVPKVFGMKPSLDNRNLEYSETKFDYILHMPLKKTMLDQIAEESFGRISTVVSKLLVCEAALDELKISYTELPTDFLVHKELQHDMINSLITRTKAIGSYMKFPKDCFKGPSFRMILERENIECTETDDHYIIQRYLTSASETRLITAKMKNSLDRFSFIAPKIATSSVLSHIRIATCDLGLAAIGSADLLALPTWLEPMKLLGTKPADRTYDAATHLARGVEVLLVEDENLELHDYIELAKNAAVEHQRTLRCDTIDANEASALSDNARNPQTDVDALPSPSSPLPAIKDKSPREHHQSKSLIRTNKKKGLIPSTVASFGATWHRECATNTHGNRPISR